MRALEIRMGKMEAGMRIRAGPSLDSHSDLCEMTSGDQGTVWLAVAKSE